MMRSQGSPLDLNNLPEDYIRDRKQIIEDTSTGHRKKKSGGNEGNEESGKVYECRFCSLKFCKSQALGGHMNRHRQERETETLNRARQLVFSNDNLPLQPPPPPPHLGCCHSMAPGSYHTAGSGGVGSDPTLSLRFPTRVFPGSSPTTLLPPTPSPPPPPPPHQPYLYSSPSRPSSFPSYYPPPQASINDYYVGHVLGNPAQCSHQTMNYGSTSSSMESSSYTCIGAPVGPVATFGGRESGGGRDGSQQQRLDVPSSINRFQDGF